MHNEAPLLRASSNIWLIQPWLAFSIGTVIPPIVTLIIFAIRLGSNLSVGSAIWRTGPPAQTTNWPECNTDVRPARNKVYFISSECAFLINGVSEHRGAADV